MRCRPGVATTLALGVVAVGIAVAYRSAPRRSRGLPCPGVSALTAAARGPYGDAFNEVRCLRPGAQIDQRGGRGWTTRAWTARLTRWRRSRIACGKCKPLRP